MCGRMSFTFDSKEASKEFDIDRTIREFSPRFNVAPSQDVPVIIAGSRILAMYKWGFIPHFMKGKPKSNLINTRAETIDKKPAFREAFEKFRCVILSSGFYEWKDKKPYYFKLKGKNMFAFAGIASFWTDKNGEKIGTCSIITTKANKIVAPYHDRMPVILEKSQIDDWIDPMKKDMDELKSFLRPYDEKKMESYPVSEEVNSVKNESPKLVEKQIE